MLDREIARKIGWYKQRGYADDQISVDRASPTKATIVAGGATRRGGKPQIVYEVQMSDDGGLVFSEKHRCGFTFGKQSTRRLGR